MKVCAGIHVSKGRLDWALTGCGKVGSVPNSRAGVRRLVAALRAQAPEVIVVEPTGGYERVLTVALSEAELPFAPVNPWRVRRFGEGLGLLRSSPSARAARARVARDRTTGEDPGSGQSQALP